MSLGRRLRRFFDGSMRANAVALVSNQLASASLGFMYWLLAARLYPVEVVGMSSAVISTVQLVSGLAQLGLVSGMQRFIPRAGRRARKLALSAYVIATLSAAVSGVLALWLATIIAPEAGIFGDIGAGWVVLAAVAWTLFTLQDGVLIGLREAVWVLVENFAYNLAKIILLVIGARLLVDSGIVASWFAPAPVAVLFVTWLVFGRLLHAARLRDHDDPSEEVTAREIVTSVSADHLGGLVAEAGVRLLPLLVVRLAGVEANAYFYQAWMISTVLGLVASGMANSFTAETAADRRQVGPNSQSILRTMSLLLIPAAIVVGAGAPLILRVFGSAYAAEGTTVLRLLAVAVLPVIVNTWYVSYLRVMGYIRRLIAVRVLSAVALVALAYAGLLLFGIAGVGWAWLASQLGMAAFAAADARKVLLSAPPDSAPGRTACLRRGDWRFLLPAPHPRTVAVFAGGDLAESVRLTGGSALQGDAAGASGSDLAVAENPDVDELRACAAALHPGGICYAEWTKRPAASIATVRARHQAAGLEDPVMYWPAPALGKARLWLRVPSPSPNYTAMLRRLVAQGARPEWLGSLASAFAGVVLRAGLLPSIVSLARRPGGGEEGFVSHDFCEWLEKRLARITGHNIGLMILMRTGGESDENKINWLVFDETNGELQWIAKAPRHPRSRAALEAEYRALVSLNERRERHASVVQTPIAVMRTEDPGFPLFVQTAVHGTPLLAWAESEGYSAVCSRLAESLVDFAGDAETTAPSQWWGRLVEPWLDRLSLQLSSFGHDEIVAQTREALRGFGSIPLVWTHNDCTPWNTMVQRDGIAMFDWETADEQGLPAVDLIYCLSTTAFSLDHTDSTPRAVESYRRLLDPEDERGEAFGAALRSYARALRLSEDDLSRLRIATWLVHTTHDLHNLMDAAEHPSAALLDRCVCLPILRAEVARHERVVEPAPARPNEAVPAFAEALFLSPHLDDAVLSCGGAIARLVRLGIPVQIVTVFTDDLEEGASPSAAALRCHEIWGAGDAPFGRRRSEDHYAVQTLGVELVHLGFLDAVYRTGSDGQPLYATSHRRVVAHEDERVCLEPLREQLAELVAEHPDAVVFCPAGTGGHVDHLLVRRAAEEANMSRVVYYDEYPYLAWEKNAYAKNGLASFTLHATREELACRVAAAECYVTQIPGLFPSLRGRVCGIVRHHVPRTRAWLPARPDTYESARRRMASRMMRDSARYGERYHWQDAAWEGPFASWDQGS